MSAELKKSKFGRRRPFVVRLWHLLSLNLFQGILSTLVLVVLGHTPGLFSLKNAFSDFLMIFFRFR